MVVAEKPEYMQTFIEQYNPAFSGEIRVPPVGSPPHVAMSERKIIARRAAMELKANAVVNLGIGMPKSPTSPPSASSTSSPLPNPA